MSITALFIMLLALIFFDRWFRRCAWILSVRTALSVDCVCSLSLHFVDPRHQQARVSQTQDFLALEAKWSVVCLGPQPRLPLVLWPRWTVIKQGCAESALHISSASAFMLFLFMLLSSRPPPHPHPWLIGDQNHMSVFVWKVAFEQRFSNCINGKVKETGARWWSEHMGKFALIVYLLTLAD